MHDEPDIWSLAAKGLGAAFPILVICSALSAAVSVYANWASLSFGVTLIPDLLFSALVEFALINAMLGRPVTGGADGRGKFQRFLVLSVLLAGVPMLLGVTVGFLFFSMELGLLLITVPLSILSYSLLGTVFPAMLEDEPGGLTTALARGRRQLGFVLPRVLGVTVSIYAIALFLFFGISQMSGVFVATVSGETVSTAGIAYDFLVQIMGNSLWSLCMATLVAAWQRESPSHIFE